MSHVPRSARLARDLRAVIWGLHPASFTRGVLVAMEYLLVNPFSTGTRSGAPSGVDAYIRLAATHLRAHGPVRIISPPVESTRREVQEWVREQVLRLDPAEVVIEAPESRAATLLVPNSYFTHVRLHCPAALAQHHEGVPVDFDALHEEINVVRSASLVTSPSNVLARELSSVLPRREIGVYRHPPPTPVLPSPERDVDVTFLGRNQRLKGSDFLADVLRKLPPRTRVVLAGAGVDLLRLGRGIRCEVERQVFIDGHARDALLARSRVVLLPSRFESFSMVLGEAFAAGTPVVAWDSGAPAELAPAPLLRIAPFADVHAFVAHVHDTLGGALPERHEFDSVMQEWQQSFDQGIRWLRRVATDGSVASCPPPPDYRATHRVSGRSPILPHILSGTLMSETPAGPFRIRRKLRKLRRDPKAFLRDSRFPVVRELMVRFSADAVDANRDEPRTLGSALWTKNGLEVERLQKRIAESDLATVVFTFRSASKFANRPLLRDLLSDKDFVGFRDRYLFAFEFDLNGRFQNHTDLPALLRASDTWNKRVIGGIRNAVFLDPDNILPFLVRATDHEVRLVICATERWRRPDLIDTMSDQVDVLIATRALLATRNLRARRMIEIEDESMFPAALRQVIIDHKDKEKNLLIPVFGDSGYIDDIDELNSSRADAVLLLDSSPEPIVGESFADIIEDLALRTRALLLRETRFHQYCDSCDRGDIRALLRMSLEDGCRYDVRS